MVGPPESMREHVVAAAKAMRNGNWSACNNYIINEKMNAKVLTINIGNFFSNYEHEIVIIFIKIGVGSLPSSGQSASDVNTFD